MTSITTPLPCLRDRAVPTAAERLLLRASRRLESLALARMEHRAATANPVTERERQAADDRRRTAQALGNLGIPPR